MIQFFFATITFVHLIISCRNSTLDVIKNIDTNKQITIVFKNYKAPDDIYNLDNGISYKTLEPSVSYFNKYRKEECVIVSGKKEDTINITGVLKNTILELRINALTAYDYLINSGDTVLVIYTGSTPSVTLLNRRTNLYDFSYDSLVRKRFQQEGLSFETKYFKSDLFLDYSKPILNIKKLIKEHREKYYPLVLKKLSAETDFLDSLKNNNLLSSEAYNFYKNKAFTLKTMFDFDQGNLPVSNAVLAIRNDSIAPKEAPYLYYYLFLEQLSDKLYTEKSASINLKDGINKDYREVYKKIEKSSYFSESSKDYLLTREIGRIIKSFSKSDITHFYEQYKKDVADSLLKNYISIHFFLELRQEPIHASSVELLDINKQIMSFEQVIKKLKGKVVYIDLWASWCVPCRHSIPFLKKLKQEFIKDDVVFIILSIDQNFDDWKKALIEENLFQYQNNFLILNSNNSKFLKSIAFETIPRYLIFDKEGSLALSDAPAPESQQAGVEIKNLTKR